MASEDIAIQGIVDKMWAIYDSDRQGKLTKEQTALFLRDCLEVIDDKYDCSKDAFDQAFTRFDDKRTGFLQKSQIMQFVKYVLPNEVRQDKIMENPQGEDGHDDNTDASSTTSSVISLKNIYAAEEEITNKKGQPPNQM